MVIKLPIGDFDIGIFVLGLGIGDLPNPENTNSKSKSPIGYFSPIVNFFTNWWYFKFSIFTNDRRLNELMNQGGVCRVAPGFARSATNVTNKLFRVILKLRSLVLGQASKCQSWFSQPLLWSGTLAREYKSGTKQTCPWKLGYFNFFLMISK